MIPTEKKVNNSESGERLFKSAKRDFLEQKSSDLPPVVDFVDLRYQRSSLQKKDV